MRWCAVDLAIGAMQLMLDRGQVLDWFSSREIIVEAERYRRAFNVLNGIDRTLLALCPPLGRLCRMTVIVLER